MTKKILIPIVLIAAAIAAFYYANYKAAEAIETELQKVNQSYADMAQQDGMPALHLTHGAISANVLTSRYSIHDVQLSMAGLGTMLDVERVQLKGVKPNQLADTGSVEVHKLTVGSGALLLLPEEFSTFMQTVQLHGDYRYKYNSGDGELWFSQQTQINDEFQFSYQFTLTDMQPLWQRLSDVMSMSASQQQAVMSSDSYAEEVAIDLHKGAISHGEIHLANDGFLERLIAFSAASGQTPSYDAIQGMAMMTLAMADGVPAEFKQSLMGFVEQPKSLTLSFKFEQPLSFAALESGAVFVEFDSPEALVKYSGARLVVND